MFCKLFFFILVIVKVNTALGNNLNPQLTKVWGPGLQPDIYILPARYFFIQAVNDNNAK